MKPDDILDAIGTVDDEYIENAKTKTNKNSKSLKLIATLAACLCVVLTSVLCLKSFVKQKIDAETTSASLTSTFSAETSAGMLFSAISESTAKAESSETTEQPTEEPETEAPSTNASSVALWYDTRKQSRKTYFVQDSARVWPWNCREIFDRYQSINFNGAEYRTRVSDSGNHIPKEKTGKKIGSATAEGYDIYEDKSHTIKCEIYEINGVDSERFAAVKYEGCDEYYPFISSEYNPPETLGDLIAALNLTETFPLTSFYYEKGMGNTLYGLSESDSDVLWSFFVKCADAETEEYDDAANGKREVAFPVFSQELGAENLSWALYDNGYLKTNIENYGYAFYIGEAAVKEIVDYVVENKTGRIENDKHVVVGTVTEIGDDYIKVDDSIMMKNPDEGIEFTFLASNMRVKRYIISGFLRVGQTVAVEHTGILAGNPSAPINAVNLEEVTVTDNDVLVLE